MERYLARLDEHVEAQVGLLQAEVFEYRAVPAADLRASAAAIVRFVLARIESFHVDVEEIDALDELARRRVAQGFPLEALTRGIQLAAREVVHALDREGELVGLDRRTMLRAHDFAWQFANDAAARIAAISRDMAVDLARRDSGRRADFLRGVLYGGIAAGRIQAEGALYGVDPCARYHPLRARPASRGEEDAISLAIGRSGATTTHRPVLAVLEGELVGLVPRPPVIGDELLVALGALCDISDARDAFAATGMALDAAIAFGRTGLITLGDLGPLPLALAAGDLADVLERRHLAALDREGQSGRDVEETVRRFLEHDHSAEQVAEAMHVHRNTVRYRLGRFRDLTGLDIRRTHDFVIAWWLLARRAARQRNG